MRNYMRSFVDNQFVGLSQRTACCWDQTWSERRQRRYQCFETASLRCKAGRRSTQTEGEDLWILRLETSWCWRFHQWKASSISKRRESLLQGILDLSGSLEELELYHILGTTRYVDGCSWCIPCVDAKEAFMRYEAIASDGFDRITATVGHHYRRDTNMHFTQRKQEIEE